MKTGIDALRGKDPGAQPKVELPVITQETLASTVRADVSDSLWLPTKLPDEAIKKLFS